jgi:hypothetical protein
MKMSKKESGTPPPKKAPTKRHPLPRPHTSNTARKKHKKNAGKKIPGPEEGDVDRAKDIIDRSHQHRIPVFVCVLCVRMELVRECCVQA